MQQQHNFSAQGPRRRCGRALSHSQSVNAAGVGLHLRATLQKTTLAPAALAKSFGSLLMMTASWYLAVANV